MGFGLIYSNLSEIDLNSFQSRLNFKNLESIWLSVYILAAGRNENNARCAHLGVISNKMEFKLTADVDAYFRNINFTQFLTLGCSNQYLSAYICCSI